MKLIIGLGNPGTTYHSTRHNTGFLAIDYYLRDKSPIACPSKFNAEICELHYGDRGIGGEIVNAGENTKVFFIKPQTFMNQSGETVRQICQFYKIDPTNDILVIHDEVDLPLGTIRLANDSSASGHNGVQDIFDQLGTKTIHRVRIGIETRESRNEIPTEAFVLQKFGQQELKQLTEQVLPEVNQEIEKFITA